jgi:hypothetical protein
MMATRKILSVLTVLLLVSSGLALSAFAGEPLPAADTEGAETVEGLKITFPETTPSDEETDDNPLVNMLRTAAEPSSAATPATGRRQISFSSTTTRRPT